MRESRKHLLLSGLVVAALSCTASTMHFLSNDDVRLSRDDGDMCGGLCHGSAPDYADPVRRQAARLRARLERNGIAPPSEATLVSALTERAELLKRAVHVTVSDEDGVAADDTWTVKLASHPALLHLTMTWTSAAFVVDEDAIELMLKHGAFEGSEAHTDATVRTLRQDKDVVRTDGTDIARAGFVYDRANARDLADALNDNSVTTVALEAPHREANVRYLVDGKEQELNLIASGVSNFENSPENREHNVLKALSEHVNNIVVQPNETFSFNNTLGGPVTLSRGWVEALGLFGGGTAMTPGGGICQAATTVYRAALMAGFPILRRKSHSVYVPYYEKYGAGIDATIFPGVQDLVFRNDTDGPIVIQAFHEGDDAYVNVYGIPDNREVTLEGPYFAATRPRPKELRPLDIDEIGWVQRVVHADGSVRTVPFVSTYTHPIARSVSRTHTVGTISEFTVDAEHTLTMNATQSL